MAQEIQRSDWGSGDERGGQNVVRSPQTSTPVNWAGAGSLAGRYSIAEDHGGGGKEISDLDVPMSNLQRALASAWQNDEASYRHKIRVASSYAWGLISGLDEENASILRRRFDDLPLLLQTAFIDELSRDPARPTQMSSERQIESFRSSDVGERLYQFWGSEADRKVSMVQSRIASIEARLEEHQAEVAWQWLDSLPERAAMGVIALLAK